MDTQVTWQAPAAHPEDIPAAIQLDQGPQPHGKTAWKQVASLHSNDDESEQPSASARSPASPTSSLSAKEHELLILLQQMEVATQLEYVKLGLVPSGPSHSSRLQCAKRKPGTRGRGRDWSRIDVKSDPDNTRVSYGSIMVLRCKMAEQS